jgi:hypothetical protein
MKQHIPNIPALLGRGSDYSEEAVQYQHGVAMLAN